MKNSQDLSIGLQIFNGFYEFRNVLGLSISSKIVWFSVSVGINLLFLGINWKNLEGLNIECDLSQGGFMRAIVTPKATENTTKFV